ncbi:unnamed protein product [Cochlearia groenlandica]
MPSCEARESLVWSCGARYENEMRPQLDSRPSLLTTPIAALSGRRLIEKAAQPARLFSDCDQEHTLDLTH